MSDAAPDGPGEAGLIGLVAALQRAGLQVGSAEAIDAGRLLRVLADRQERPADLRAKLRPVFCKSREDRHRFDEAFSEWAGARAAASTSGAPAPETASAPQAPAGEPLPPRRRARRVLMLLMILAGLGYVGYRLLAPAPGPSPALESSRKDAGPAAPAPTPQDTGQAGRSFDAYYPKYRENRELRPGWVWGSLAIPLVLLLMLGVPGQVLSRTLARRSGRRVELDVEPLRREAQRIVPAMAADVAGRLERHLRAEYSAHGVPARRAPLHVPRTVEATLRNLGVPTLRFRHALLRPSYLVLIDAEGEDDPRGRLFYLWAERLLRQGLDVDIRLFRGGGEAAPVCYRSNQPSWRDRGRQGQALDRLDDPPPGQRLVMISSGDCLADGDGRWRTWGARAGFRRWPQRALFTPTEPRDWGRREEAIERSETPSDPGFLVLPLDEDALRAWSELLATGELPDIVLDDPQRFPRLLEAGRQDVLGDQPIVEVDALVAQLKLYLGENGFQWLCACAVAPVLRWELTLLIGERLFRLARVESESQLRYLISRNYRRLARLPWLRARRMPDWLRLRLLAELPAGAQAHIREALRTLLDPLAPSSGEGLTLEIEPPPGRRERRGAAGEAPADVLYLGYMSGLSARQLALRAPPSWSRWLGRLRFAPPPGTTGWRYRIGWVFDWIRAHAAILTLRGGFAFGGARRNLGPVLAVLIVGAFAIVALGRAAPESLPPGVGNLLFAPQSRLVALTHPGAVLTAAFSPDGGRIATLGVGGEVRVWDSATGAPSGTPLWLGGVTLPLDRRLVNALIRSPLERAAVAPPLLMFSPDGRHLFAAENATGRLWNAETGIPGLGMLFAPLRDVQRAWFSPDGRRLLIASFGGVARLLNAETGAPVGGPMRHSGGVLHGAFSEDGRRVITASADGTTREWDAASGEALGAPVRWHPAPVVMAAFSPDWRRVVTGRKDRITSLRDAGTGRQIGADMRHEMPVQRAMFSPDGRRIVTLSGEVGPADVAGGAARLWDGASGEPIGAPMWHAGGVTAAAFSSDSRRLLTAGGDGTARLWDAASGAALGEVMRHAVGPAVNAILFSPDGAAVATAGDDNRARIWVPMRETEVVERVTTPWLQRAYGLREPYVSQIAIGVMAMLGGLAWMRRRRRLRRAADTGKGPGA